MTDKGCKNCKWDNRGNHACANCRLESGIYTWGGWEAKEVVDFSLSPDVVNALRNGKRVWCKYKEGKWEVYHVQEFTVFDILHHVKWSLTDRTNTPMVKKTIDKWVTTTTINLFKMEATGNFNGCFGGSYSSNWPNKVTITYEVEE